MIPDALLSPSGGDRQVVTEFERADAGVEHFMGGHCTGIEAVFRLREGTGLSREKAVVAAVGSHFTLGEGIEPPGLAK